MGNRDIAAVCVLFLITPRWQKIEVFTSKAFRRKGTAVLTNIYNQGNIEQQSKATFDTINYKENHFPSTTATTASTTRLQRPLKKLLEELPALQLIQYDYNSLYYEWLLRHLPQLPLSILITFV